MCELALFVGAGGGVLGGHLLGWRCVCVVERDFYAASVLVARQNDGSLASFPIWDDVRTFDVGQPMSLIVDQLNIFQPQVLTGYATVLRALGEAQERGELIIRPTQLGNGGEPLTPDVKAYLERIFRVPVMNAYASSEHLYMGMTLPGVDGMHLMEDDLIFELGTDHTCVTNLFNDVMPLIRYRMDDVLVPDNSGHSHYPFTRIKEVVGRHESPLVFTNQHGRDEFIHPIVIVELVVNGLKAWQIVLESKTSFRFRARFDENLTVHERQAAHECLHQKLIAILEEKEMLNVRFEIEPVKSMELDPVSGKFRLVMREPQVNSHRNKSTQRSFQEREVVAGEEA